MRLLIALTLSAALAACGGSSDDGRELRPGEATLLAARVAAVRDAVLVGDRTPALDAVVALRETVVRLSPRLEPAEQRALRTAVRRISARVRSDLKPPPEDAAEPGEESVAPLEEPVQPEKKPRGKGKGKKKGKG